MTQHRGGAGNFAENLERAREAGKKGGQMSSGNFKYNRERAVEAGRAGGKLSRRSAADKSSS
ncbi:general stress protein [Pantoea sp. KPR_PJ]|uniref:general stress protein n=1 Tax=Pantoea sp. KPR_PJ TaxID=2738375 RepID=UPI00352754ED